LWRATAQTTIEAIAVPYGVYDINNNTGWVSVGTDHDTAAFAVNAIRRWWVAMGKKRYPKPKGLTADGGGSNGYRVRLWKIELQKLADESSRSRGATCRLEPASGIKSSTGFSRSSASTGAANPCAVFAQSSSSLPLRPSKQV
jgi:hypothetical protein